MNPEPFFASERRRFHRALLGTVLTIDGTGVPSIADKNQRYSVEVSTNLIRRLGATRTIKKMLGQHSGLAFEAACTDFLSSCFEKLDHLRRGPWSCVHFKSRRSGIESFAQYRHLSDLERLGKENAELRTALGNQYMISPDIVIYREPFEDHEINECATLVGEGTTLRSPLRKRNDGSKVLLASVSCKWTLRSDRAQNARSEALNLIRNRKGRCPQIVVITAEPASSRIASLALGTGDLDCVYHFALDELRESVVETDNEEALQMLDIMIEGKRLRDISDLPLDLLA